MPLLPHLWHGGYAKTCSCSNGCLCLASHLPVFQDTFRLDKCGDKSLWLWSLSVSISLSQISLSNCPLFNGHHRRVFLTERGGDGHDCVAALLLSQLFKAQFLHWMVRGEPCLQLLSLHQVLSLNYLALARPLALGARGEEDQHQIDEEVRSHNSDCGIADQELDVDVIDPRTKRDNRVQHIQQDPLVEIFDSLLPRLRKHV